MLSKTLLDILFCPHSHSELTVQEKNLVSATGMTYPLIGEIPWLKTFPESDLKRWASSAHAWVWEEARDQDKAARQAQKTESLISKAKWDNLRKLHQTQALALKEIFKPLFEQAELAEIPGHLLPSAAGIKSHTQTLFRDWSWGQPELNNQLESLKKYLGTPKKILFLGAGACGLPKKIHNFLKPELSVAIDTNPFLVLCADKLLKGENLQFSEFAHLPKNIDEVAKPRELKGSPTENFSVFFADAQNLPFKEQSFDLVVSLWLIDVLTQDFSRTCAEINSVLKPQGSWLNLGLMDFRNSDGSLKYVPEEVREKIEASGFNISAWENSAQAYMSSPLESLTRKDILKIFAANKIKHLPKPDLYLETPAWLLDETLKVPVSPWTKDLFLENEISRFVLGNLDGQSSILDIANRLQQSIGLPPSEAQELVRNFFFNKHKTLFSED